jgi:hypothetical protein
MAAKSSLERSTPKIAAGLFAAAITPVIAAVVFIPLLTMIADYGCKGDSCLGITGSVVLGIWSGMCAGPIAIFHVAILGLPAALIGAYFGRINLWTCAITGFLIGCIPTGVYVFSDMLLSGNSFQTTVDKSNFPAFLGMLAFGASIRLIIMLLMGSFGVLGGFSFWVIWRTLTSRESTETRLVSSAVT